MNKGGRQLSLYWEKGGFTPVRDATGKLIGARCNEETCKKVLKNTAVTRLQEHRHACKLIPSNSPNTSECGASESQSMEHNDNATPREVDEIILESHLMDEEYAYFNLPVMNANYGISTDVNKNKKKPEQSVTKIAPVKVNKHQKLKSFIDVIQDTEKVKIDTALAEAFVSCSISFDTLESQSFKQFIKVLRPAYELPSIVDSQYLFNNLYTKLSNSNNASVIGEKVVMYLCYDDNSVGNESIVCLISADNQRYVFIDEKNIGGEEILKSTIDDLTTKFIKAAEQRYRVSVYAVLSDFESNLPTEDSGLLYFLSSQKAIDKLKTLLIDDDFVTNLNCVSNEFKDPMKQQAILQRFGSEVIIYDNIGNWRNFYDAVKSCDNNFKIMKPMIFDEDFTLSQKVQHLLIDDNFKTSLKEVSQIATSILDLESKLRQKDATIADVTEVLLEFHANLKWFEYETKVEEMLNDILNPVLLMANFLHPTYKGQRFEFNQLLSNRCEDFSLDELSGAGLSDLHEYKNANGIFNKLLKKTDISPTVFWSAAQKQHIDLATLALKLIRIPASTISLKKLQSGRESAQTTFDDENNKKLRYLQLSLNINSGKY